MFVFPTKKIQVPGTNSFESLSWQYNFDHIAIGGKEGQLKVIKLSDNIFNDNTMNSSINSSNVANTGFSDSQNLDGHDKHPITIIAWNEVFQKLTTCDSIGIIIVWAFQNGIWVEEMVNNRAKSFVVDLKWSNDGTKIAIAYDDGHIIVGGTDGNKDWTKDTEKNLRAITWGQDDTSVIVGLGDGTLHVYDAEGNPLVNLQIIAIETLELDIALDKDVKKNYMVALEYYTPTAPPQLLESFHMDIGIASSTAKAVPVIRQPVNVFRGPVSLYTPRLLIVYQHVIQICVNELDTNPVIVRIPKFVISGAKWSPDGQCIAVAGKSVEDTGDKPVIQFLSVWGHFLRKIRIDGTDLGGFSWDGTGKSNIY